MGLVPASLAAWNLTYAEDSDDKEELGALEVRFVAIIDESIAIFVAYCSERWLSKNGAITYGQQHEQMRAPSMHWQFRFGLSP
jgi:hypothetical protein